MPATRKVQSQETKKVGRHSPERRRWTRSIVAIVLGIAAFCVIIFFLIGGPARIEKGKFESYLNDKYGQAFIVENVRETGVSLGGKGNWTADAYPKADSSLDFEISRSQSTGHITMDKFLQALWTKQASKNVEAFLAEQLPENDGYFLQVTAGSPVDSFYKSIQGGTPDLDYMLEKHKDQLSYSLSVRAVSNLTTREPTAEQLNEALKVINFAKTLDIDDTRVGYMYRDPSFMEKDKIGQQRYQYGIQVESGDLNGIQTATDISKYFSKLR